MRRLKLLFFLAGAAGLALYLWPALRAPIVLWSDSRLDLSWAQQGIGLWKPLPAREIHPLKPGYLIFLRLAGTVFPIAGKERSIVIVQSLLLWASILLTSAFLARRRGGAAGLTMCVALFSFLRLRDSASAIMSEALAAALFLPLCAVAVERPVRLRSLPFVALSVLVLFWVRPNVGGIAFLVLLAGWGMQKTWRQSVLVAILVIAGGFATWGATRRFAGEDAGRGIYGTIVFGSTEYNWWPSLKSWTGPVGPFRSAGRLRVASSEWRNTLELPAPDRDRELRWRALHGIFGLSYYDSRWSRLYAAFDRTERIAGLLLLVAGIAFSVGAARRDGAIVACAGLLLALLIAHNLLFGSSPRLILPFLPGFFLMGAAASFRTPASLRKGPMTVFALLAIVLALIPEVLSWDWGQMEAEGITLEQRIPRHALPLSTPATLHVRIAPPGSAAAQLIASVDGRILYRSTDDHDRLRPLITVPVPQEILDKNAAAPVVLRLTSTGDYDTTSYLLFPVIPAPWRAGASRRNDPSLSPATDISRGGLDWWAHSGSR